jgi:hypothetical protein
MDVRPATRDDILSERGLAMKTSAAHADPAFATVHDFPDLRGPLMSQIAP